MKYSTQGSHTVRRRPKDGNNGNDGVNIYLDLDNEHDSLQYDNEGNKIGGNVVTHATLYVNGEPQTNAVFTLSEKSYVEATLLGNAIFVTSCSASSGYVVVSCTYNGITYNAKFSITRIVGEAKYELQLSANALTYNTTSKTLDRDSIDVEIYRTDTQGARSKVVQLADYNLNLYVYPNGEEANKIEVTTYADGKASLTVENELIDPTWGSLKAVVMRGSIVKDYETVGISKVENGDNGTSPYILSLSSVVQSHDIDAETKKTLGARKHTFYVQVYQGDTLMTLDSDFSASVVASGVTNALNATYPPSATLDSANNRFVVSYSILGDVAVESGDTYIEVTVTIPPLGKTAKATHTLSYTQRGMVGMDGAMAIPCGTYENNKTYSLTKNSSGEVLGRPVVWEEAAECYYALLADSSKGNRPSEHTSDGIWKEFAMMEYVFAKMMFAQFAQFGSAVMWGDYLFSEKGINQSGATQSYVDTMFTNGKLNGTVIPNFFVDLLTGAVSMRKLSELFEPFYVNKIVNEEATTNYLHLMDMNRSHNVTVAPRYYEVSSGNYASYDGAIILPQYGESDDTDIIKWSEDGTHVTIAYQFDASLQWQDGGFGAKVTPFILVCADARMFNSDNYKTIPGDTYKAYDSALDNDGTNCFIWRGWRSKFILLSHGNTLKLRSVKTIKESVVSEDGKQSIEKEDVGINWYVENSSDFVAIPLNIEIFNTSLYSSEGAVDTCEKLADITLYNTINSEHDKSHIALGGGLDGFNESVFTNAEIFLDLGLGAATNQDNYVQVGFQKNLDDIYKEL